jgi:hypothetical protein
VKAWLCDKCGEVIRRGGESKQPHCGGALLYGTQHGRLPMRAVELVEVPPPGAQSFDERQEQRRAA